MNEDDPVALALHNTLISPNVEDSNGEAANIVDAISLAGEAISRSLYRLGNADAATSMGGLEALGKAILEAAEMIKDGLYDVASAVREHNE